MPHGGCPDAFAPSQVFRPDILADMHGQVPQAAQCGAVIGLAGIDDPVIPPEQAQECRQKPCLREKSVNLGGHVGVLSGFHACFMAYSVLSYQSNLGYDP